jgi:hypothetical protein
MKRGTVTGEVKSIIKALGLSWDYAYSDNRVRNSVGVKLVGTYLTESQREVVKGEMIERGFTFRYIRENANGWRGDCNGTRFCFTRK